MKTQASTSFTLKAGFSSHPSPPGAGAGGEEVGEGRCLGTFGLSPPGSASLEPPQIFPRDRHPEATFSRPSPMSPQLVQVHQP